MWVQKPGGCTPLTVFQGLWVGSEHAPRFSLIDGSHHGGPSGSPKTAVSRALAEHASHLLRIHEGGAACCMHPQKSL